MDRQEANSIKRLTKLNSICCLHHARGKVEGFDIPGVSRMSRDVGMPTSTRATLLEEK